MLLNSREIENALQESGQVIVLEAEAGQARLYHLQECLKQAEQQGSIAWLLTSDRDLDGPWAGVRDLLTAILPQAEAQAPDLLIQHDYELTRVLPELRRTQAVRYPSLTDIATQQEQIRNYPADRAIRIIHGIIDFLKEWFKRSQATHWVIICDRYDHSGGLVRIFFAEFMRRCAQQLNLTLLVAISPEANRPDVIGKFDPKAISSIQLSLPIEPATKYCQQTMLQLAASLEQKLENDVIEQEISVPRLIHYLHLSNQPKLVLKYQIRAAIIYNRKGFYEDGLAFAKAALLQLKCYSPDALDQHWVIDSMLYTSYVSLDKPQEALAVMERAMQRTVNPDDLFRGYFMLAMLYIRALEKTDIDRAEGYLEKGLIELDRCEMPEDLKVFHKTFNRNGMALIRYRQGRSQSAVELCQWCYAQVNDALKPEEHLLYRSVLFFNIAQVYDFIGNYPEAICHINEALTLDPNYSEYYNIRGNIYFKMGRLEDALQSYIKAIQLSAPYPEVWINIGQCYRRFEEFPKALHAYSKALDLQPNQASVLIARGQAFEMTGDLEAALTDYNVSLTLDPDQPYLLANRAVLLFEKGCLREALSDLSRAIELDHNNADLYQNRAVAFIAIGRIDEAVNDLKTYLHLCPDAENRLNVENQLAVLQGQ